MTDEQFQKLMEKLEEIRRAQVPMYVGYPIQPQIPQPTYDPTRCSFCGGYHSLGGVCPHLFPTLTDHARTS